MRCFGWIFWLFAIGVTSAQAQHQHMMSADTVIPPMERMGSGTTWIPDAVVIPSVYGAFKGWNLMAHGILFGYYDRQDGPRGADQFGSLNWAMLMATHDLAGGRIQFRTMLSLDPATVQDGGYPLLLQTGETYRGQALRDRQHPHDFWMELGALYEQAVTADLGLFLYAAPSGEPALGPVAFMHRPSAFDDPAAPLGHHWQDATHITFGVVTAGVFGRRWKAEISAFNGREPDEERWGYDRVRLNSYSGRVTVSPHSRLNMTLGYGKLEDPEILHPGEDVQRVAASLLYGDPIGDVGQASVAAIWGANRHAGSDRITHSALVELGLTADTHNTVTVRTEFVQKSGEELAISTAPDATFDVAAVSVGYIREFLQQLGTTTGIGIRGTLNWLPSALEPHYGSRTPVGLFVFLRLRPTLKPAMQSGMKMQ